MAATVTLTEIRENTIAAPLPDSVLLGYIALVDQANMCLDGAQVADDLQRTLKLNAIWHLVEIGNRGSVSSEGSPNGASRSYQEKEGLQATPFGQILQAIDQNNCLTGLVGNNGNSVTLLSVGGTTLEAQRRIVNRLGGRTIV